MARDKEDDDPYEEEFDFVDDDDDADDESDEEVEEEAEEEAPKRKKAAPRKTAKGAKKAPKAAAPRKRPAPKQVEEEPPSEEPEFDEEEPAEQPIAESEESLDEFGRPAPVANYVVHVYEHRKFKRTIDRDFTPEDAEAFTTDYNKYAKSYGRVAVPGKKDVPPKKSVEMAAAPILPTAY